MIIERNIWFIQWCIEENQTKVIQCLGYVTDSKL